MLNTFTLTSPLFQYGSMVWTQHTWTSGVFEAMAIVQAKRIYAGKAVFACDQATLEQVDETLSEAAATLAGMIGSLGSILSVIDCEALPARALKDLGYLIEGLCSMQEDLSRATDSSRASSQFAVITDPHCCFDDGPADLDAHLKADVVSSETELHAGLNDFRSLMQQVAVIDDTTYGENDESPATALPQMLTISELLRDHLRSLMTERNNEYQKGFLLPLAKVLADTADWEPVTSPKAENDTFWFGDTFRPAHPPAAPARKAKSSALATA